MPVNEPATVLTVTVNPAITDAIVESSADVDVERLRPQVATHADD